MICLFVRLRTRNITQLPTELEDQLASEEDRIRFGHCTGRLQFHPIDPVLQVSTTTRTTCEPRRPATTTTAAPRPIATAARAFRTVREAPGGYPTQPGHTRWRIGPRIGENENAGCTGWRPYGTKQDDEF